MKLDPRNVLERLCAERGENYASLSRMIGRNEAYIQQYLKKGSPRQLRERERRVLARHFRVPETLLGGAPCDGAAELGELVPIHRSAVRTASEPLGRVRDESTRPHFAFDPQWLASLTVSPSAELTVIRIEGDSMAPTLGAGDDVLVDLADSAERLRDGIYALLVDQALVVKRLAVHPVGRRVTVQSDNPAYRDVPDCLVDEIECIGRVIWAGRRIA